MYMGALSRAMHTYMHSHPTRTQTCMQMRMHTCMRRYDDACRHAYADSSACLCVPVCVCVCRLHVCTTMRVCLVSLRASSSSRWALSSVWKIFSKVNPPVHCHCIPQNV